MSLLVTVVLGLMRGLQEGMIMWPDGVREHLLFDTYHLTGFLIIVLAVILILELLKNFPGWIYTIGLLILLWECTEIGYNLARWVVPFRPYEHVVFFDIIDVTYTGLQAYLLHVLRLSFVVVFLTAGIVMKRIDTELGATDDKHC